ncbi:MAG: TonB-dependent receptor [Microscillaceae bacterium]|nr:TonB-dependent receptor [Microscillaceae bacterium]
MKNIYLLFFLVMLVENTIAQTQKSSLAGKITDQNKRPVSEINVFLEGTSLGASTDFEGRYKIENIPMGVYTLKVSGVGFESRVQQITIQENANLVFDLELHSNTQELQEIVISDNQNNYKVDNLSSTLRLQTSLLETPQNIQVVNSQLLSDQQVFDMLEGVSRNVSGVSRSEHWDNYARIVMRGSQIAAFRNGMNVQMPWGPLAEDMSMVDRIEFVKGPAGFMLANGEPSGFYNVVTKKPTGIRKGTVALSLGSFDTYRATLDLDGKISRDGKLLYRLNLMGQLKGSHRDFEFNNRYSIVPVIKYQINDQTSLTAEYTLQYLQMSMIGAAYAFSEKGYGDLPVNFTTAEANLEPTNIKDQSIFLTLNHQINTDWGLTAQLAYLNYKQIGSSMWPVWGKGIDDEGNLARGISIWDALGINKIGQVFLQGNVKTGFLNHRILAGLDMSHKDYFADWFQSAELIGSEPFNIYNPQYGLVSTSALPVFDRSQSIRSRGTRYNQSYVAIYLQDELRFWEDRIRLTLAGRFTSAKDIDPYAGSTDNGQFTPRVGISVSIDKQTSVYALYDQAFVPQAGSDFEGNNFEPITGNNMEIGLKKDWFNGRWNATLSAYQITKNNVLTADPAHINFSIQLGQTQTQGIELDVRGELLKGLDLTLNYAYTNSEVTKDTDPEKVGVPVAGATKHISNAWLSYKIQEGSLKGLGASLGYQWQVDRSSWYVFDGTDQSLPDYFRMDGSLSWQSDKMTLTLNVNNLLNKYLFSGSPYDLDADGVQDYYWQAEPKRNFRLGLAYKF